MNTIPFVKYQGAGNDFVLIDDLNLPVPMTAKLAAWICDRHFGVGADGVLMVRHAANGQPKMEIWNSDGSRAEMCGNGIRCFARELVERKGFDSPIHVATDAGTKVCAVSQHQGQWQVAVAMGGIRTENGESPLTMDLHPENLEVAGRLLPLYLASTGNPHAVLFGRFSRAEMEKLGPALTTHPRFPAQTNVEFVTVLRRNELALTVHERGAGFTLACGTGSVATAAVAVATRVCDANQPILVHLPGGDLHITVHSDFSASVMEGPAERVFEGTFPLLEQDSK